MVLIGWLTNWLSDWLNFTEIKIKVQMPATQAALDTNYQSLEQLSHTLTHTHTHTQAKKFRTFSTCHVSMHWGLPWLASTDKSSAVSHRDVSHLPMPLFKAAQPVPYSTPFVRTVETTRTVRWYTKKEMKVQKQKKEGRQHSPQSARGHWLSSLRSRPGHEEHRTDLHANRPYVRSKYKTSQTVPTVRNCLPEQPRLHSTQYFLLHTEVAAAAAGPVWGEKQVVDDGDDGERSGTEHAHSLSKAKLSMMKRGHHMERWPLHAKPCTHPEISLSPIQCRFYKSPLDDTINQGPPVCTGMQKDHPPTLKILAEFSGLWKHQNNPTGTKNMWSALTPLEKGEQSYIKWWCLRMENRSI